MLSFNILNVLCSIGDGWGVKRKPRNDGRREREGSKEGSVGSPADGFHFRLLERFASFDGHHNDDDSGIYLLVTHYTAEIASRGFLEEFLVTSSLRDSLSHLHHHHRLR